MEMTALKESLQQLKSQGTPVMEEICKCLQENKIPHRTNSKCTEIVADTTEKAFAKLMAKNGINLRLGKLVSTREQRKKTYIRLLYE